MKYKLQKLYNQYKNQLDEYSGQHNLELSSEYMITCISLADPNQANLKHTEWLINTLLNNGFLWEDIESGSESKCFNTLNHFLNVNKQLPEKERSLNKYKDLASLYKNISPYIEQKSGKSLKREDKIKAYEQSIIIYDKNDYKILIPTSKFASCFWGKQTQWCTASTESTNYFDYYSSDGPLFICITPDEKKYQFHRDSEPMDEYDSPIKNITDPILAKLAIFTGRIKSINPDILNDMLHNLTDDDFLLIFQNILRDNPVIDYTVDFLLSHKEKFNQNVMNMLVDNCIKYKNSLWKFFPMHPFDSEECVISKEQWGQIVKSHPFVNILSELTEAYDIESDFIKDMFDITLETNLMYCLEFPELWEKRHFEKILTLNFSDNSYMVTEEIERFLFNVLRNEHENIDNSDNKLLSTQLYKSIIQKILQEDSHPEIEFTHRFILQCLNTDKEEYIDLDELLNDKLVENMLLKNGIIFASLPEKYQTDQNFLLALKSSHNNFNGEKLFPYIYLNFNDSPLKKEMIRSMLGSRHTRSNILFNDVPTENQNILIENYIKIDDKYRKCNIMSLLPKNKEDLYNFFENALLYCHSNYKYIPEEIKDSRLLDFFIKEKINMSLLSYADFFLDKDVMTPEKVEELMDNELLPFLFIDHDYYYNHDRERYRQWFEQYAYLDVSLLTRQSYQHIFNDLTNDPFYDKLIEHNIFMLSIITEKNLWTLDRLEKYYIQMPNKLNDKKLFNERLRLTGQSLSEKEEKELIRNIFVKSIEEEPGNINYLLYFEQYNTQKFSSISDNEFMTNLIAKNINRLDQSNQIYTLNQYEHFYKVEAEDIIRMIDKETSIFNKLSLKQLQLLPSDYVNNIMKSQTKWLQDEQWIKAIQTEFPNNLIDNKVIENQNTIKQSM